MRELRAQDASDGLGLEVHAAHAHVRPQCRGEVVRRLKALLGIGMHRAVANIRERPVDLRHDLRDTRLGAGEPRRERLAPRLAVRGVAQCDRLPQHDARREHVDAAVRRLSAQLFRGGVADLTLELAGSTLLGITRLGDAEVEQLDAPVVRHEQVRWTDVAVYEVQRPTIVVGKLVHIVQTGERFRKDVQAQREIDDRFAVRCAQDLAVRLAIQKLHDQEVAAVLVPSLQCLNDIGMAESARQRGLSHEHLDELRVACEVLTQHLEHDQLTKAAEPADRGEVNRTHAALAEQRDDLITSQLLSHALTPPRLRLRRERRHVVEQRRAAAASRPPRALCGCARRWRAIVLVAIRTCHTAKTPDRVAALAATSKQ
jgi:hypothetical protein